MDNLDRNVVLYTFCRYYKLDYERLDYTIAQQLMYIYHQLSRWTGQPDPQLLLIELQIIEQVLPMPRSRVKRLYKLYEWMKHNNMNASRRYDTKTKRAPLSDLDKLTVLTRKSNYR